MGKNVRFTAEMFASASIKLWRETLQKATPENKAAAIGRVSSFYPTGATPIYDALHHALFIPEIDTILCTPMA
ncbi:MAG: hypothetical protein N2234_06850 [Planctomycetota bacterium]|nr:hypothetical protein [Planctomycetota bacterium]